MLNFTLANFDFIFNIKLILVTNYLIKNLEFWPKVTDKK